MVDVIAPLNPDELANELTAKTKIAQFKDLEIHLFHAHQAPKTMQEVGRIREIEFRQVGAGRSVACDIDSRDTTWPWYHQLVSWDPQEKELVAMYRFIPCKWAIEQGGLQTLRTSELFQFSPEFIETVLTSSIELGRSVVNRNAKRALQGLFSVWTGLGALMNEWPYITHFFGNVSLYQTIVPTGIAAITQFLDHHHGASENLVTPMNPPSLVQIDSFLTGNWDSDFQSLQNRAKEENWFIPPILVSYLKAHRGLAYYGTSADKDFGNAWEAAITVPTTGLEPKMITRFVEPYQSINPEAFQIEKWTDLHGSSNR